VATHHKRWLGGGAVTLSGGASGQTAMPTAPRVAHGQRASLGPGHEEGEVNRMAITGGHRVEEQGGMAVTHQEERRTSEGVDKWHWVTLL
jgi:hypothetical protein